jgi:hypothetical protein
MPKFHKDEVARLEDIEALLVTARDLADRFHLSKLAGTSSSIPTALMTLRSAKTELIDEWRATDSRGR